MLSCCKLASSPASNNKSIAEKTKSFREVFKFKHFNEYIEHEVSECPSNFWYSLPDVVPLDTMLLLLLLFKLSLFCLILFLDLDFVVRLELLAKTFTWKTEQEPLSPKYCDNPISFHDTVGISSRRDNDSAKTLVFFSSPNASGVAIRAKWLLLKLDIFSCTTNWNAVQDEEWAAIQNYFQSTPEEHRELNGGDVNSFLRECAKRF